MLPHDGKGFGFGSGGGGNGGGGGGVSLSHSGGSHSQPGPPSPPDQHCANELLAEKIPPIILEMKRRKIMRVFVFIHTYNHTLKRFANF